MGFIFPSSYSSFSSSAGMGNRKVPSLDWCSIWEEIVFVCSNSTTKLNSSKPVRLAHKFTQEVSSVTSGLQPSSPNSKLRPTDSNAKDIQTNCANTNNRSFLIMPESLTIHSLCLKLPPLQFNTTRTQLLQRGEMEILSTPNTTLD
ncbi:hypothetical protein CEXT_187331 [Caerostris extrusa]|uniref:Uncharacterized protein n=1 Tax=Caerostris extrusa TaxID=172846 RepID=A0AAV4VSD8_CAEEX|nr:hypothetical protein CEXT_187331 [Caerostris extrusa]